MYNLDKVVVRLNRIKDLRKEKGWTQGELGARLGELRQQAISKYEKYELDLDTDKIRKLCEIFGCTADYLLCMSSVRTLQITEEDAELIAAYHVADEDDRAVVDHALKKYMKKEKPAERA